MAQNIRIRIPLLFFLSCFSLNLSAMESFGSQHAYEQSLARLYPEDLTGKDFHFTKSVLVPANQKNVTLLYAKIIERSFYLDSPYGKITLNLTAASHVPRQISSSTLFTVGQVTFNEGPMILSLRPRCHYAFDLIGKDSSSIIGKLDFKLNGALTYDCMDLFSAAINKIGFINLSSLPEVR